MVSLTGKNQRALLLLVSALVFVAALMALQHASAVILPILIASFLAAVLQPIMERLKRFLPRSVALIVVLFILGTVMLIASLMFVSNVQAITAKIPEYAQRFEQMSAHLMSWAQSHGINITPQQLGTKKSMALIVQFTTSGLTSVFSITGQAILVLFLLVFLTLELHSFRDKFSTAFGSTQGEEVLETFDSIAARIQTYALTKTIISLLTGLCTWLIGAFWGLDFAFFWGLLAFLLNFIPTIGSVIAVVPPTLLAFLQFAGWQSGTSIGLGLITTQVLIGNALEPKMMGRSMNLSPLVVFISMLFWGWLWGITGMVMAVPLTVGIKIICEHIERLHPVAILLGDAQGSTATAQQLGFLLPFQSKESEKTEQTDQSKETSESTSSDSKDADASEDTSE